MIQEPTIQERIALAKSELARYAELDRQRATPVVPLTEDQDDWTQVPPIPEPLPALQPGDVVHFYGTTTLNVGDDEVSSFRSITTEYGREYMLTPELLKFNTALWDLVDDPDAQERRWRRTEPLFRRGPWPADRPKYLPGSYEEDLARTAARDAAFLLTDENERRAALRAVDDTFGLRRTSQHLATYEYGGR